ncbi:VirB4 family type IV secretion system protein [Pseudobacillus sp. 179-B 2D1 NHS]|uniref:VirB4 family type IV secretion system protein n=1 Tax=Pseudobacillus sp. 179-B 2D1 NHS TaxID=3374292 RepID=UPI00387A7913
MFKKKDKKVKEKKAKKKVEEELEEEVSEEQEIEEDDYDPNETPVYQLENQPNYWDVIAPEGVQIKAEDYGVIKQSVGTETYFRPIYIPRDGYPRKMQTNWMNEILSSGEVDVMIDIHKVPKTQAVRSLQKQETMLRSNLSWQTTRGNIDQISDLRTKIDDTTILMDEIQFSENDMFHVSTSMMLYANSKRELDRYSEYLEDLLAGSFFKLVTAYSRIKKAFLSISPIGKNYLHDTLRNLDRRALGTFSPFISGSGIYTGGVPFGINKIDGRLEFINSFGNESWKPDNYNVGIFGISGSGKSVAMKLKIAREMAGANIYAGIIDPEGEFVKLTKLLDGVNLDITEESGIIINPCSMNYSDVELDVGSDEELELLLEDDEKEIIEKDGKIYQRFVPVREKINEMLDFFDFLVRGKGGESDGLDVFERSYLEEAIGKVLDDLGITTHPDSLFKNEVGEVDGQLVQSQVRKPEPEILQIYETLQQICGNDPKAERLIAAIKPFLRTGSMPLFDGQTYLGRGVTQTLDSARLINFNISSLEEGFLRPVAFHVILNYLWEYFIKDINRANLKKYIYADELWQFVDNEQTVSFFEKIARRIRKRNGGLVYASQDFVRLLESPKARGILTNTFTTFFLRQNKIDLRQIRENFNLTQGEIDILFANTDKGEGILRIGENSVWLQTNPSEEEMLFIESNQAVLEEFLRKRQLSQRKA